MRIALFNILISIILFDNTVAYQVGSYTVKLTNPTDKKKVNVIIHYPKTTTKNIQFPVIVFNHGATCHNTWYNYVWQSLVPLGYIVAMPGDDEGTVKDENLKQYAAGQRITLDYLRSQCDGIKTCPIYGLVSNTSAAMGHSMGGAASIVSISNMDLGTKFKYEFDAGFGYSACNHESTSMTASKQITKPFFLMTGVHDCICPPTQYSDKYYKNIPGDSCKYLGDITNGDHCNWEDTINIVQCQSMENSECPKDKNDISPKQQQEIGIKYSKLFLNATLYGNTELFSEITKELQSDLKSKTMSDIDVGAKC